MKSANSFSRTFINSHLVKSRSPTDIFAFVFSLTCLSAWLLSTGTGSSNQKMSNSSKPLHKSIAVGTLYFPCASIRISILGPIASLTAPVISQANSIPDRIICPSI